MDASLNHRSGHPGHPDSPARIGPNAILRPMESLAAGPGRDTLERVFKAAGLSAYLESPPEEMVDEREVTALHRTLREVLGIEQARAISRDAGRRTGDYLLARRIPRFAQRILKLLPARLSGPMLLKAIAKNAWTFKGSGTFEVIPGNPHRLSIAGCRVCLGTQAAEPLCDYYGGTFERLFRELVDPGTRVTEVQCQAQGHPACIFEVRTA